MSLLIRFLVTVALFALSNAFLLPLFGPPALILLAAFFVYYNVRPARRRNPGDSRRLTVMMGGYELFMTSAWLVCALLLLYGLMIARKLTLSVSTPKLVGNIVLNILILFVLLANGFFRILVTSTRLRLVLRILLICLWWCPVVNIILIWRACSLVKSEYRYELARRELDDLRKENEVCKTKYPLVLVHGIFFRDWQLVNYWGRIPKELIRNGAEIHYGRQQSSAAVADSAAELGKEIVKIISETGCEKVNLIAHSKGGLDARYAITHLGLAPFVASLTTVNTPHRGCIFAQTLMDRLPEGLVRWIAARYNAIFRQLGDTAPDFLAGVTDLRSDRCSAFNESTPDVEGVLYQSVMSTMKKPSSAGFPLSFSYRLVKKYDREENDGLVALSSARWGDFLGNQTAPGKRGISHGDVIDLMREDIPGYDVREFYVGLVKDLKERGF